MEDRKIQKNIANGQATKANSEPVVIASDQTVDVNIVSGGNNEWFFNDKDDAGTYIYFGFSSSAGWRIKRKTVADGSWKVAAGAGSYATEWTNRVSQTYNYYV